MLLAPWGRSADYVRAIGQAIGQALPLAVGIALSPIPIICLVIAAKLIGDGISGF